MEWPGKAIIDVMKLPLKYIWAIAIAAGLLLFMPQSTLERIHLSKFASDFGAYIGTAFLVSSVLIAINIFIATWGFLSRRFRSGKLVRKQLEALLSLDAREKSVLREFFLQGQSTLNLPTDQPTVAGLLWKGILVMVSNLGTHQYLGMIFSVTMPDGVKRQLTDEMIDLPRAPSEAEKQSLQDNRPDFIKASFYDRLLW